MRLCGLVWPRDAAALRRATSLDVQAFEDHMALHKGSGQDHQQTDFIDFVILWGGG
jgi:hypothetical protein